MLRVRGHGSRRRRGIAPGWIPERLVVQPDVLHRDVVLPKRIKPLEVGAIAGLLPLEVPVGLQRDGRPPVAGRVAMRLVRPAVERADDDADTGERRARRRIEDAAVEPHVARGDRGRAWNDRRDRDDADAAGPRAASTVTASAAATAVSDL